MHTTTGVRISVERADALIRLPHYPPERLSRDQAKSFCELVRKHADKAQVIVAVLKTRLFQVGVNKADCNLLLSLRKRSSA